MHRALDLARHGIGLSSPNPAVGCVVLDRDGAVAGEGWHEYDKRDHAEVVALRMAGHRARGGTAYVTLEPCNHTGRTGPCSEALIAAGVARVVAATVDPNPRTSGGGLERLRQAGVIVETGICETDARRINEGFARWIVSRRPHVHMKVAMTLDGRIAPAAGVHPGFQSARQPYWITGEPSRAAVQELRWAADAVLTGIDTVIADDPLLTDRSGRPRRRPVVRVVLDSLLRLPLDSRLVATSKGDVLVFTVNPDEARRDALEAKGIRVESLSPDDVSLPQNRVPLAKVLARLGQLEILNVLTETGTRLNTSLLEGGFVDRLTVFTSPQLLGSDAVPAFGTLTKPVHLTSPSFEQIGEDSSVSGLLRDPGRCEDYWTR
jgi:diaminohydroxyphosphoribosylaminopyrimidine deaminase/5-amino-6-(5-phosphoribosylamino)uracil reductase